MLPFDEVVRASPEPKEDLPQPQSSTPIRGGEVVVVSSECPFGISKAI